jgi:hypothetical protein
MAGRKTRKRATKRQPTAKNGAKTARLNLLIRPDLKKWAHEYAGRMDKSLSSIINDYLLSLRERERGDCVEQI